MPVFRGHDSVREKSSSFFSQAITFGFIRISFCRISGTVPLFRFITGGGLPRIDVIGYNPRRDWGVLMARLLRVSTSDQVSIE